MSNEPLAPTAAVDALYAVLDPLSYGARMRALADWTRSEVRKEDGARGLRALLDELSTRGAHGRRLAAVAAAVGGDTGFLADRLASPDAFVRGHALKSSLHLPIGDEALERAVDDAPAVVRRQIASAVVAAGRTALAERLLARFREEWGDEEAARLLPGCGARSVERLLPELFPAVVRWRALGRSHPDLVLDEVARQLAELPETSRAAWWQRNAEVFAAVVEARPLRVVDLLERHCPVRLPNPVRGLLGRLMKAAPGRTIALITAPGRLVGHPRTLLSRTALKRLARREPSLLTDLGRAWSAHEEHLALLLRALPPSGREACYDAARAGQDLGTSSLGDDLLDALPRRRAQAEARRMAAQALERGAPWDTVLRAVAHLPVAEARERLIDATRRPAAEDRAVAWPSLVRNAARSGEPAAVAALLDDMRRLRNEQEPVRSPALAALADVPPRLFSAADADLLDRIAVDAVEARDSSVRTRRALSSLALAVLREHAGDGDGSLTGWALATLERLSGHTGGADLGRLGSALRRGQEFQVFEALRPWLEAGADRADHALTFALARALGRRAHHMPKLQELLLQAIQFGSTTTVRRAVGLWLDAPATRDERVAEVLGLEPSAVVLPDVLRVLTHRRTDLLDAALADTPPYGRFLTHGARWVPPVDAAGRWLPRQQAAAARVLARAAGDASAPTHTRAAHIRAAAALPDLGHLLVRRYVESANTHLAEAALGALAHTDRPDEALPLLLAHAGDDRARVALYAATRVSGFIAPSRLAAALRDALLPTTDGAAARAAKVTSRKELVRLAATRLPVDVAAALLSEAFHLPGQHPDVQAACVLVAAELVRAPAARELLEHAADGPPVTRAALLRIRPFDLRPGDRAHCARLVGRVAGGDDRETADHAMSLLARWSPWCPEVTALLSAHTVDLDDRSSWRAAADGLVALAASADGAGPLLGALSRLADAEARAFGSDVDAAAERDRPARRRVDHLVGRLSTAAAMGEADATRKAAEQAGELLCRTDGFLPQGTHLLTQALDLDAQPAHLRTALEHLAMLHADRPALAARTAETIRARFDTARRPGDPPALLAVAERLAADAGHATGLLALALTQALGARTGWREEWRTLLRALRRHAHPDVRDSALALATAVE